MNADLFPEAVASTPHALWLTRHDLRVIDYQDRRNGGWSHHGLNTARFLCCNRAMTRYASGETQELAEQAYCLRHGLAWWKLAEWNGAMAGGRLVGVDLASGEDESITMLVEAKHYGDIGVVAPASMEL